jgi:hypothetical protein
MRIKFDTNFRRLRQIWINLEEGFEFEKPRTGQNLAWRPGHTAQFTVAWPRRPRRLVWPCGLALHGPGGWGEVSLAPRGSPCRGGAFGPTHRESGSVSWVVIGELWKGEHGSVAAAYCSRKLGRQGAATDERPRPTIGARWWSERGQADSRHAGVWLDITAAANQRAWSCRTGALVGRWRRQGMGKPGVSNPYDYVDHIFKRP